MTPELPDLRALLADLPLSPLLELNAREGRFFLPDATVLPDSPAGAGVRIDDVQVYDAIAGLCCPNPRNFVTTFVQVGTDGEDVLGPLGASAVLFGLDGDDRLKGTREDDVLFGGAGEDHLVGAGGRDIFVMADDGERDLIRDFDPAEDLIDVSDMDVTSFEELDIQTVFNRHGRAIWLSVSTPDDDDAFFLRFRDRGPLLPERLEEEHFVFAEFAVASADPREIVLDGGGFNQLRLTDAAEQIILVNDDIKDIVRNFDLEKDVFDARALDADSFEALQIEAVRRGGTGDTLWVRVRDATGEDELFLRYADRAPLDPALLNEDHFIFD